MTTEKQPIRRIYVRKKAGFDLEAQGVLQDLRDVVGLSGLTGVTLLQRYEVADLDEQEFAQATEQIFAVAPIDEVSEELPLHADQAAVIAVEALPGQFDQRAESAAQCIQLLTGREKPACRTAKIYLLAGDLSAEDLTAARNWLINPVESRVTNWQLPPQARPAAPAPEAVAVLSGFRELDAAGRIELIESGGYALTPADLEHIQNWFIEQNRDPSETELRVLDTYWSDHCRHTTFHTSLETIRFAGPEQDPIRRQIEASWRDYCTRRETVAGGKLAKRPVTLMDLATIGTRILVEKGLVPDLDVSEEINACSINAEVLVDGKPEDYLILFKNETHNHPTEIEPFGGAATCLGGCIRDPLSGRAYVYQAMRVTGAADPTRPIAQTLPGKLPQRKITQTAAAGYSSYGNQIGLATGLVDEIYHPGYLAKRMEIGAVIGAVPKAQVRRGRPQAGDVVILLGGRTGRDGIGGATGSSKGHTEESLETSGSEVQKGNPVIERKIQRLFCKAEVSLLIKRCNDFGAGGVSVAIGELADGLHIHLDRVPLKYDGLNGTEIALSESQERMAVVVEEQDAAAFIALAKEENLEATVVAEVTAEPRLVMTWRGERIVDLCRTFIDTNGAEQHAEALVQLPGQPFPETEAGLELTGFADQLIRRLNTLNQGSRKGLTERFDASIGAGTVLMPFGGRTQSSPEMGMAALIPLKEGQAGTATLMSYGFDPYLSEWSPYHGAYYAVLTSLSKILALGGDPARARLTFQEYFERLTRPEQWGKPLAALLGAYQAQLDFEVPSIGGKDSMSGSFGELHVPPTLVSFAVATADPEQICPATFPEAGLAVFACRVPRLGNGLPDVGAWRQTLGRIRNLQAQRVVRAATVADRGGLATAVVKACLGENLGFCFQADSLTLPELFAAEFGSLIIAVASAAANHPDLRGADFVLLGETCDRPVIRFGAESIQLAEARLAWQQPLADIFPEQAEQEALPGPIWPPAQPAGHPLTLARPPAVQAKQKPRVLMPVFPGTNCELDTARAFAAAGGEPVEQLIRDLTPEQLAADIQALSDQLAQAEILAFPGGFSSGDEPEGSAKFITAILRHPIFEAALNHFLEQRQGLILGICNGFQALIKSGLLSEGRLTAQTPDSPTLTFNRIGRHVSRYVTTRVETNRSPWLRLFKPGELHQIPISHGEGRLVATAQMIETWTARDQIAFRYAEPNGAPSLSPLYNPSGSTAAIEGLISEDGRILGKMGHAERSGPHIAKNIPGNKQQNIFRAGITWFTGEER